jgi:hypothetical protein
MLKSLYYKIFKYKQMQLRDGYHTFDGGVSSWGHNVSTSHDDWSYDSDKKVFTNNFSGVISPKPVEGDKFLYPIKGTDGEKYIAHCVIVKVNKYGGSCVDWVDADIEVIGFKKRNENKSNDYTYEVSENAKIMLEGRTKESHPEQYSRGY